MFHIELCQIGYEQYMIEQCHIRMYCAILMLCHVDMYLTEIASGTPYQSPANFFPAAHVRALLLAIQDRYQRGSLYGTSNRA